MGKDLGKDTVTKRSHMSIQEEQKVIRKRRDGGADGEWGG